MAEILCGFIMMTAYFLLSGIDKQSIITWFKNRRLVPKPASGGSPAAAPSASSACVAPRSGNLQTLQANMSLGEFLFTSQGTQQLPDGNQLPIDHQSMDSFSSFSFAMSRPQSMSSVQSLPQGGSLQNLPQRPHSMPMESVPSGMGAAAVQNLSNQFLPLISLDQIPNGEGVVFIKLDASRVTSY